MLYAPGIPKAHIGLTSGIMPAGASVLNLSFLGAPRTTEILGVLALAAGLFCARLQARLQGKLRPIPFRSRPLVSRVTESGFALLFSQEGVESRVARTTYRYLHQEQGVPVPPLPGDHLLWDLGLSEAQVEQSVVDLARRLSRRLPAEDLCWPSTVEALVVCMDRLPQLEAEPSSRAA